MDVWRLPSVCCCLCRCCLPPLCADRLLPPSARPPACARCPVAQLAAHPRERRLRRRGQETRQNRRSEWKYQGHHMTWHHTASAPHARASQHSPHESGSSRDGSTAQQHTTELTSSHNQPSLSHSLTLASATRASLGQPPTAIRSLTRDRAQTAHTDSRPQVGSQRTSAADRIIVVVALVAAPSPSSP